MRRYLQRTQAKAIPDHKAWSIIGHLEGEARNYIINKAESERDTPEKVFDFLASRFGTGGNRIQVRQAFATRQLSDREDWMQYLDALEGCEAKASLVSPSPLNVMNSCSALSKAFVTQPCGGSSPLYMRPNPRSQSLPLSNHCDLQHGNCSVLDQGRRPMTLDTT